MIGESLSDIARTMRETQVKKSYLLLQKLELLSVTAQITLETFTMVN